MINIYSIKIKFFTAVFFALAFMVAALLSYFKPLLINNEVDNAKTYQEGMATYLVKSVDIYFQNAAHELETIAPLPAVTSMNKKTLTEDNTLHALLDMTIVGNGMYAYLVSADGQLITHPNIDQNTGSFSLYNFKDFPPVAKVIQGESGQTEYEYDGQTWIASFKPIPTFGGGIIVQQPKATILDHAKSSISVIIKLCIATAIICYLFVALIIHLTLRPLTTLVQDIKGKKIPEQASYPRDEIGQLTQQFAGLYTDLLASTQELSIYKSNLEQKVDRRTDQLKVTSGSLKKEIRERELVEGALHIGEEELRAIYEDSATGITLSDMNGKILRSNPSFQKMVGYNAEELLGKYFSEFTHPDDRGVHLNIYEEMLAGHRDHFHMTKRFVHKEGRPVWVQITVSLIRDDAGAPLFVSSTIENINIRRQLEEEQLKSRKLESIGNMAGGIAHDFNNLLTGIIGNIALSKIYTKPDDKISQILDNAEKSALKAKKLTQKLLTFARGGKPVKQPLTLPSFLKNTAERVFTGTKIVCEYVFDQELKPVEVDRGQAGQMFQNLLENAKEAMSGRGKVFIKAQNVTVSPADNLPLLGGDYVRITIKDQGCGIPDDQLDSIFDPYFSTKADGSGLGLAVVYSIVKNHAGYINVQSSMDSGTEFQIYLPVSRVNPDDQLAEKVLVRTGRILVMDDEEAVRRVAYEMLRHLGFTVGLTVNGEEALATYKEALKEGRPFDLVILDLTIPGGMGGKETITRLLAIDPNVKALVSSGYANDPIMSDYKKNGFIGIVPKPYSINQLQDILDKLLHKPV